VATYISGTETAVADLHHSVRLTLIRRATQSCKVQFGDEALLPVGQSTELRFPSHAPTHSARGVTIDVTAHLFLFWGRVSAS
jgi:hypothetical protein